MIAELLQVGKANAVTGADLCKLAGLSLRELSQAVMEERRQGAPICATCDNSHPGYYLAGSREEMSSYCEALRQRAGEIFKTRAACLKTLDSLPGANE